RMSIGPSALSTATSARPTASRSATSAVAADARPPAARTSAAPASAASASRSTIPTARPPRASPSPTAPPQPPPPPGTRPTQATSLPAAGQGRRERAAHGDLTLLVDRLHLAVDPPLAVRLVLPGDLPARGDRVTRPDAGREAHLEAAQVLRPHVVGHAAT